jgi:hypothetical protein
MRFKDDELEDGTLVGFEYPLWVQFAMFPLDLRVQILHFSLTRPSSETGPGYRPHHN